MHQYQTNNYVLGKRLKQSALIVGSVSLGVYPRPWVPDKLQETVSDRGASDWKSLTAVETCSLSSKILFWCKRMKQTKGEVSNQGSVGKQPLWWRCAGCRGVININQSINQSINLFVQKVFSVFSVSFDIFVHFYEVVSDRWIVVISTILKKTRDQIQTPNHKILMVTEVQNTKVEYQRLTQG